MAEFTRYAHGTPCWVDVTAPDIDGAIAFYEGLFGWASERAEDPAAGGYTMFTLRGKNVAAASPPMAEGTPPAWTTYLASDDVDSTAAKVREAGGTVFMDPFDVLDSGRMTVAADPTGAVFGVWQAGTHIGAQLANEPGTLLWNQCETNDVAGAADFYVAAFGYEIDEVPMPGLSEPFRVLKVEGRGIGGVRELGRHSGGHPHWATVFAVADVDARASSAEELGGSTLMPGVDIPGVGRVAVLRDPSGAAFQVMASESPPA